MVLKGSLLGVCHVFYFMFHHPNHDQGVRLFEAVESLLGQVLSRNKALDAYPAFLRLMVSPSLELPDVVLRSSYGRLDVLSADVTKESAHRRQSEPRFEHGDEVGGGGGSWGDGRQSDVPPGPGQDAISRSGEIEKLFSGEGVTTSCYYRVSFELAGKLSLISPLVSAGDMIR